MRVPAVVNAGAVLPSFLTLAGSTPGCQGDARRDGQDPEMAGTSRYVCGAEGFLARGAEEERRGWRTT